MEEHRIIDYKIQEHSFIARIAAVKLRTSKVAIVIGKTIYLNNTTAQEFLSDKRWVKHEECHIQQFANYGMLLFILMYLWESMLHGYQQNKYEIEARQAEEAGNH